MSIGWPNSFGGIGSGYDIGSGFGIGGMQFSSPIMPDTLDSNPCSATNFFKSGGFASSGFSAFGATYSLFGLSGGFFRNGMMGPFGWSGTLSDGSSLPASTAQAAGVIGRITSDPRFGQLCPSIGNSYESQPEAQKPPPKNVPPPTPQNMASRLYDKIIKEGSDKPEDAFTDDEKSAISKFEKNNPGFAGQKDSVLAFVNHINGMFSLRVATGEAADDLGRVALKQRIDKWAKEGKSPSTQDKILALLDPAADSPEKLSQTAVDTIQKMMGKDAAKFDTKPKLFQGFLAFLDAKWNGNQVAIIDDLYAKTLQDAEGAGWNGPAPKGKDFYVNKMASEKGYAPDEADKIYDIIFKDVTNAYGEEDAYGKIISVKKEEFKEAELKDPKKVKSDEQMLAKARCKKFAIQFLQGQGVTDNDLLNDYWDGYRIVKTGKDEKERDDFSIAGFLEYYQEIVSKKS